MLWKGFQRPKRLELERETLTDRFGRFYAQPFERGFGTTVGNAIEAATCAPKPCPATTAGGPPASTPQPFATRTVSESYASGQDFYAALGFEEQPEFLSIVVGTWLDNDANR